jgi:thiamine-phosphate pyrophosphorylase
LRLPRLLAVSDPVAPAEATGVEWSAWCAALAAAGVDGLQLRDRALSDARRFERARAARGAFARPRTLLVNRRVDLALAADADGVQLPASGLPLAPVREAIGARLLLGRSTHAPDEVARARDEGADFVLFGPVFETPSKAGRMEPRGISSLAAAVRVGLPVVAIGGIDAGNAAEVQETGAYGLAAIRLFAEPRRDRERLLALAAAWNPE